MSNVIPIKKERPTTMTILIDQELRDRLERSAEANERSLGAEVRVAIRAHLEQANEGDDDHE
jgi:predicted transcriptional regulator